MISLGEEGIAVADEQASLQIRKFNIAQKLRLLNDSFVYGGSGAISYIREIYDRTKKAIEEQKQKKDNFALSEVYQIAQGAIIDQSYTIKNIALLSSMGFGLSEFLAGTLAKTGQKIDPDIMKNAAINEQKVTDDSRLQFLLGGVENKRFEIYMIDSGYGGVLLDQPYGSIGSGSDESSKVLSGYLASLPREKRNAIDRHEGLIKIIEATNASSRLNIGVGGSPSIVYVKSDGGVIRPNEKQCILASEIVQGLGANLLDRDFSYNAVSELVYSSGDFDSIEEEMKQKATDWKKLDRILRGYKE